MARWKVLLFVLCMLMLPQCILCYRPVVILHGILSSQKDMEDMVANINEAHPGTKITNIDGCNDRDSLINMWKQKDILYDKMKPYISGDESVILICYSQGGLTCRAILEMYDHNVHTFISLSSPQAGQFGDTSYLNFVAPNLIKEDMYLFFYSEAGQDISVGDYWNDPFHQKDYYAKVNYLPTLNNATDPKYKENFSKLSQLVLIGGPDDGVITPWQSSQFGFYANGTDKDPLPYTSQYFYTKDSFGLKTLSEAGKIITHTVAGVQHTHWHGNKTVFKDCIEPYLT